ncbi:MAG: glutamine synthetase [Hyphomicrobiales bacterium]|nr:glutamine synthetase [Hyphomicrobiales bacterium]
MAKSSRKSSSGAGASGFAERHGLISADAKKQWQEVLARVRAEDLEVIRISFADQHGILRGKTIMAKDLESAVRNGVTMVSTLLLKDTSHRTVFPVWQQDAGLGEGILTGAGDFVMLPDPSTFRVLPWSPHSGWLLADIFLTSGEPVPFSSRHILGKALEGLTEHNADFVSGLEVEFHVYRVTDAALQHSDGGMPQAPPETSLISPGYQYLTEDHYDQIEPVMDMIRRACEKLDLPIRSMEVEFGASQCEITFHPAAGMAHADNMMLFRSAVKQLCRREGLHATFMSRPRVPNAMGSGWHLHQSLVDRKTGANMFIPQEGELLSQTAAHWVAGILEHARASCLLKTPTLNGYKRYQPFQLAPDRVQWGQDNKGAMIRTLAAAGDKASRIENRVGDPAANPYFYLASQVVCGLDGLNRALQPPPPSATPYATQADMLPKSLGEALEAFSSSQFYRSSIGAAFVDYLSFIKQAEWNRYLGEVSEWEHREYFRLF